MTSSNPVQAACRTLAIALALAAGAAHGDAVLGFDVGAGSWQQALAGDLATGADDVDLERDLGFDRERGNVYYGTLEHGVPFLPNLRLNRADIDADGRDTLTRTLTFGGQTFSISEAVSADVRLEQTDAVLYYELLDRGLSVDLGVAARWVDGAVSVVSASGSGEAAFEGVIPLLYGRTRLDLPFSGLWLAAEASGIAYRGHSLLDASALLGWTSGVGLGAQLGWRTLRLELDEVDEVERADIDVSGPFLTLHFRF
ncbi:MAG: TIGR04219 family outer membrane beta-barrel protein [Pseudomonadales bacterium]